MNRVSVFFSILAYILISSCSTSNRYNTSDYISVYTLPRRPNSNPTNFVDYLVLNKVIKTYEWGKKKYRSITFGKYKESGDTIVLLPFYEIYSAPDSLSIEDLNNEVYKFLYGKVIGNGPLKFIKQDEGMKLYDITEYSELNEYPPNNRKTDFDFDEIDSIALRQLFYYGRTYYLKN